MALVASLLANAVIAATPATPLPWYNFQDYPQKAFDREWQGTTTMAVLIDPAGRVADCSVIKSSGYAELDKQTCWVAMRRVKFSPAIDPNGQRAYGLYRSNVIWSRPDRDFVQTDPGPDLEVKVNALPAGTMQPAAVKLAYYVDAQGNPSSCTVLPESEHQPKALADAACSELFGKLQHTPVSAGSGNVPAVKTAAVLFTARN
jgi:TonB family protein